MKPLLFAAFFSSWTTVVLAGSATWNFDPISSDWNAAANWTPTTVPNDKTDVATFGGSNTNAISLSVQTRIDSIVFDSNASAFTINTVTHNLSFFGPGVINNSANKQNFTTGVQDGGRIQF